VKTVIEASGIVTKFGQNIIHDGVSFSVGKGEIFGILGGSGAGKSTILRQLVLLQKYQSGQMRVLDKALGNISRDDANELRTKWGVLFQFGALFSSLSVLDNICVPLFEYTKLPRPLIEDIALAKLSMVGLPRKAALLQPSELSGGMKKRVGLARALALDPELLFLDEPTSGLDPASAEAFDRLIVELRNMLGFSVVVVTHDLDTIKDALDRFIVLYDKKVLFEGSYKEALRINHPFLHEFFKRQRGGR
jgi:phospholipid/cholesterol/gamma-HCH transport system ATP-binding protein